MRELMIRTLYMVQKRGMWNRNLNKAESIGLGWPAFARWYPLNAYINGQCTAPRRCFEPHIMHVLGMIRTLFIHGEQGYLTRIWVIKAVLEERQRGTGKVLEHRCFNQTIRP